ncbi:MAG: hypothetical protein M1818_002583 [Claussenomyces sp. TS43310]|nr:MAG: hypothetical protein M1818_002583 [Claussenomyces sp. TS43310]
MSQPSRSKQQQQPLDVLQSMINGVLIETGKALRSANKKGYETIGHTNIRLQAFIPSAIDNFHMALDELEYDIVRAKAALTRDLRQLKEQQYALDNSGIENLGDTTPAEFPTTEHASSTRTIETEGPAKLDDSIVVKQAVPQAAPSPAEISPAINRKSPPEVAVHESLAQSVHDSKSTDALFAENATDLNLETSQPETSAGLGIRLMETQPEKLTAATEAPTTADLQNMDIDAFFDTGSTQNADLIFDDLEFTTDDKGHQNLDFGNTTADLDLSSFGDQVNSNNDDITAMLQGLDNYGSTSGNDLNMMDLSNTGTNDQNIANNLIQDDFGMSGGDLDMALGVGNNQSTFDDLLDGMDFPDGTDDGTGGNIMEHGEFDEAFFGVHADTQ